MRKVWLCIFYALCIFTIVFSLFWMALPRLPLPSPAPQDDEKDKDKRFSRLAQRTEGR